MFKPFDSARPAAGRLRAVLNGFLFDLNSRRGRVTNMLIMGLIVTSVLLSMVGTIEELSVNIKHGVWLFEIVIGLLFGAEYFLRLYAARRRMEYALSFYGLVDLLTWLPLLLFSNGFLAIRLLRIFRLLKLVRYLRALRLFFASLIEVFDMVFVVLSAICIIVLCSGNLIYLIEPETFKNAYMGCWWSLVTMTTVGYGDIVPHSIPGKIEAAVLILVGITMFALLTGTISVKLVDHLHQQKPCPDCGDRISPSANFCSGCGVRQERAV